MRVALVVLLAVVAAGRGGYAPWAGFALELGAAAAIATLALRALLGEDAGRRARYQAWKRLPFGTRHPRLGRFFSRGAPHADVEILMPGRSARDPVELDLGRYLYPFGFPLRRTGLGLPVFFLTLWIAASLIPLDAGVLHAVSGEACRFWQSAFALAPARAPVRTPWSVVPFLTLRSLWIWLAVVAVFFWALRAVRDGEAAVKLALLLLCLGALSGGWGFVDWVAGFRELLGQKADSLRATGSFGNPNHFAAFQSMLLLVGVGFLASYRERNRLRGSRREPWDRHGVAVIAGLGIVLLGLGLVLSLSRSGLAFSAVGAAAWVLLTRNAGGGGNRRALVAVGFVVVGLTLWIGIEPLLARFGSFEREWAVENGRPAVWRDSLPAVGDFWLTGAGLSAYRYVGPIYRSFGGRIFYSWAHNDYLQLGIELGVPGLWLLSWMAAATVAAVRKIRADLAPDPARSQLHAGFVAAVITMALHSLTDFGLHLEANLALLAVVLAVAVGFPTGPRAATPPRRW